MSAYRVPGPARSFTDGGERLELGDVVVDREAPEDKQAPAVVINKPPVPADEWVAYRSGDGDVTVAEDNPEYDDDRVVAVVFEADLAEWAGEWDGDAPLPLAEAPRFYSFPHARLRPTGRAYGSDADTGAEEDDCDVDLDTFDELAHRLAENAETERDTEDGEPVLRVEKLGETHTVYPDGSVDGGPVAGKIEDVAAEYLGGEAQ